MEMTFITTSWWSFHPWSFDRKLLTQLDCALKVYNNPNSASSSWCFLVNIPVVLLCECGSPGWTVSISLSSLIRHSSPSCRGSENGAHSLSPCMASSLLFLLELSLPLRPSLPPAAAEFRVVQATHPLAPKQMDSCHWRPENVATTIWRQRLWQVAEGYSHATVNPLVVGRIKLWADRWIHLPKITTHGAENILLQEPPKMPEHKWEKILIWDIMKMIKDTTLSPRQAPDLFSRRTSKSFKKKNNED